MKEFICVVLLFLVSFGWAQTFAPKNLTLKEKQQIIDQFSSEGDSWEIVWGKYLASKKNFRFSPPKGMFIAPAEFEKSEGVCLSWIGYSRLLP
ncbi:hypothetical protein [Candidatus Uabimicrobium sp. HlEnr_7]|uniref:hypothetical protein n=1 Tax=Candidatus Uabimicrobium helgolandensis TaxID=3095367 RepID=UPI003556846A